MKEKKKWNWQQDNWPEFEFDAQKFQKYEREFLLGSGKLSGALEHLHKPEKDDLQAKFLSEEAIKTSEIEGEYLDRDSVQSSIQKKFGMKAEATSKLPENAIADLMIDCFENFETPLTHDRLFSWHQMICRGRNDLQDIGKYRSSQDPMQVVSGQIDRPKVHFEAPDSSEVLNEMDNFLQWIDNSDLSPLIKASVAHMYFISIHPFEDGNGRIVRAICEHILSNSLNKPSFTTLSRQIEKQRKEYYDILEKNNKNMDIEAFIEWFCIVILDAQKYALSLINFTIKKTKLLDRLGGKINSRQKKVLLRMFDAGPEGFIGGLSASNYMKVAKTTIATTTRDLVDLVEKNALRRTGERKTTRYWLNI